MTAMDQRGSARQSMVATSSIGSVVRVGPSTTEKQPEQKMLRAAMRGEGRGGINGGMRGSCPRMVTISRSAATKCMAARPAKIAQATTTRRFAIQKRFFMDGGTDHQTCQRLRSVFCVV